MPAPFAMPCVGYRAACSPAGVPGAVGPGRRRAWPPPDFRPPRGLPARSPSAPRASLGASARSPARPRRPRGGLQSGGAWYVARPCPPDPPAPSTPAVLCRWCVAGCVVSKPFLALPSLTVARCRRCVASPDCVCFASLHARSLMSHVIPVRLFQDLNCYRWYFNVSACCCGVGPIELRAILLRNRHIGTCWCRRSFA